jgi:ferredoxin
MTSLRLACPLSGRVQLMILAGRDLSGADAGLAEIDSAIMAAQRLLKVDWPACKAHGVCAELVPELVSMDEWGYPLIEDGPVPEALLGHAQRAVSACPTLALSLVAGPPSTSRRRH